MKHEGRRGKDGVLHDEDVQDQADAAELNVMSS